MVRLNATFKVYLRNLNNECNQHRVFHTSIPQYLLPKDPKEILQNKTNQLHQLLNKAFMSQKGFTLKNREQKDFIKVV